MKKSMCVFALFMSVAAVWCAGMPTSGISLGGGTILDGNKSGGLVEIGFPLYVGKGFQIRDYAEVEGLGGTQGVNAGVLALGDKVSFGGDVGERGIWSYSYFGGGVGVVAAADKNLNEAPYYFAFEGGGGVELAISVRRSFFIEIGGGYNGLIGSAYPASFLSSGFAHLALGFRAYF